MEPQQLESKAIGALLGTFTGDALGMPVEGYSPDMIASAFGRVEELLEARLGKGTYTDDTQMMIGVAESLADCGRFRGAHMAKRFVENFQQERGYGSGAIEAIYRLSQGTPWHAAGQKLFGGGSFGNGAAMRIAPIGALYANDLDRLARIAASSARITHTHPLGVGGAVLQALSVGLAFRSQPDEKLDTSAFLSTLEKHVDSEWEAYRHKLEHARELLEGPADFEAILSALGNGVSSQSSVPTAIYCFLSCPDSFPDAVETAVNLGGDTDTIGAMAGALSGARLGWQAIPEEWRAQLENGKDGRDYVIELGRRLSQIIQQGGPAVSDDED